jgi:DNA-binding beta-propeller fold protein YncE
VLALTARADLQERNNNERQEQQRDRNDHDRDHRDRDDDDDDRDGDRRGHDGLVRLPTGQFVSPTAIDDAFQQYLNPGLTAYPNFIAGEAVKSQLSPDGATLAVLTAGQNSLYKPDGTVDVPNSTQYIFLYNVVGQNRARPMLTQVLKQVNSHVGLAFSPDGNTLYAAGGSDDAVYVYTRTGGAFAAAAPIPLGHFAPGATGSARNKGVGLGVQPNASGMDVSADGRTLVVANNYNDSISVIDTATRTVRYEHDLRPFFANNEGRSGRAGGTFPYGVVVKGNTVVYVSSDRDREVVVVDVASQTEGHLIKRIKIDGNGLGMTLNNSQSRLYVAQDNADQVAVIDTLSNRLIARIDARAPEGVLPGKKYTGAATSAVALSPDGDTLYAVNSGANSIAVIPLSGHKSLRVNGLIPTAYEPHDVTFSADGRWMYIVSGKSVTGPNPNHLASSTGNITSIQYPGGNAAAAAASRASNQYQFQLERASLVSAPVPGSRDLDDLTERVAKNNFYSSRTSDKDEQTMRFLSKRIKHVIYVVKENRTFDQILGDLTNGANADPNLTQFGQALTPNNHNFANRFVTLEPMADVFDTRANGRWNYTAEASTVLATTTLALAGGANGPGGPGHNVNNVNNVRFAAGPMLVPQHDAAYWDRVTAGFDFSEADQVPTAQFNRVLWTGLIGDKPYPVVRGADGGTREEK